MLEGMSKREAGNASESFTKQDKDAADTLPRKPLLDTIVTSLTLLSETIPTQCTVGQPKGERRRILGAYWLYRAASQ
jgi:hypothetical protein